MGWCNTPHMQITKNKIKNRKESLYIEILMWAFDKSTDGFTEQDLYQKFNIQRGSDVEIWYLKVFRGGSIHNSSIIDNYIYKEGQPNGIQYWCLTEKGMSYAIDYKELKEAQKSGKRAMWIAIISIIIGVFVGIAQLIVK